MRLREDRQLYDRLQSHVLHELTGVSSRSPKTGPDRARSSGPERCHGRYRFLGREHY
jgi:hypothetical protein